MSSMEEALIGAILIVFHCAAVADRGRGWTLAAMDTGRDARVGVSDLRRHRMSSVERIR